MPLFAALSDSERVIAWIAVAEAGVATAIGMYFVFRKKRREDGKEDAKAEIEKRRQQAEAEAEERQRQDEAERRKREYDYAALVRVNELLERNEAKARAAYDVLQAGVTEKIIVLEKARHDADLKAVMWEERYRASERRVKELDRQIKRMEDPSDDDHPAAEGAGGGG